MKKDYIPLKDCEVRSVYILNSRNLSFGIFDESNCFIGLRRKFNSIFLDKELHFDCGGTAFPLSKIQSVPYQLCLKLSLGSYDRKTGLEVQFDKPIVDGGKGWFFKETGISSKEIRPCSKSNNELFNYLKNLEEKLNDK